MFHFCHLEFTITKILSIFLDNNSRVTLSPWGVDGPTGCALDEEAPSAPFLENPPFQPNIECSEYDFTFLHVMGLRGCSSSSQEANGTPAFLHNVKIREENPNPEAIAAVAEV